MNVENIKSELQQVLDSDVALRKEYNEIKRSLSDYRNQLIQRDEDCKRLQVSIDVLNTKLVVMERDNTNYKSEVSSFKDLRNTIREQLNVKQEEINGLLSKIDALNEQLASIASEYKSKISNLQTSSQEEILNLKSNYENQLSELKTNTSYQQNGIRSELESKISELTSSFNSTLSGTSASYETQIDFLKSTFATQLESVKAESENRITSLTGSNSESLSAITSEYEAKINALINQWDTEKAEMSLSYESQLSTLSDNFSVEKSNLISFYEVQISDLTKRLEDSQLAFETELTANVESITSSFSQKETELKSYYEAELASVSGNSNSIVENLKAEYEQKLSNTIFHSTEQNSKLTSDLNLLVVENEHFKENVREMVYHSVAQNTQVDSLTKDIELKAAEINKQIDLYNTLSSDFEGYKTYQLSSIDEQIHVLNIKISELELLVSEKDNSIKELTATITEKETTISSLLETNSSLQSELYNTSNTLITETENFESFKNELELNHSQQLESSKVEFSKLLAENTSLISEIDSVSDKLEATEEELILVKLELSDIKAISEGKAEDLKETLNSKNYELTNLSANNVALQTELDILKSELESVRGELKSADLANESALNMQEEFDMLLASKTELENQINGYQSSIGLLNTELFELNASIGDYQTEISNLKSVTKADEQDAFIDRLFKQIDILNDEKLSLLSEKEEMAVQLLKMNDTVSVISKQVDAHDIDITELDNHRKNIILANGSSNISSEKTGMKKQINELVREIDKCIALLSA